MVAWALFILFFIIWLLGGGWAVNYFGAESYLFKVLIMGVAGLIAGIITAVLTKAFGVIT